MKKNEVVWLVLVAIVGTVLLIKFWWLLLIAIAVAGLAYFIWKHREVITDRFPQTRNQRERAAYWRSEKLRQRAEQQHAWSLDDDDRGTYGDYPPEEFR